MSLSWEKSKAHERNTNVTMIETNTRTPTASRVFALNKRRAQRWPAVGLVRPITSSHRCKPILTRQLFAVNLRSEIKINKSLIVTVFSASSLRLKFSPGLLRGVAPFFSISSPSSSSTVCYSSFVFSIFFLHASVESRKLRKCE